MRAQILYYMGENLSARSDEFALRISAMTGATAKAADAEVDASIARLFTYAAWADKLDGAAKGVPLRGLALGLNEPTGIIGALAPDEAPLLGLVSVIGPSMAMGNRLIVVASQPYPLAATDFYQVLETSDVPAGVVNILTGSHGELAKTLADHMEIDAAWSFSSSDLSGDIERRAAANLKRTWVNHGENRDWFSAEGEGREFLSAATEIKTVWVPYGEG